MTVKRATTYLAWSRVTGAVVPFNMHPTSKGVG